MKNIDRLLLGKDLNQRQSQDLSRDLLKNRIASDITKQILVLLHKKGEDSNELSGFVHAVRSIEKPVRWNTRFLVDGCGTGGDGKHTFNISTLACLVAAAAGAQVAKHGNRSVSSLCGSSDLLESLGVKIDAPQNKMLQALKECGFGYFHAPLYHPIFKQIQPIRAELAKKKIKTLFNLTGPFLNPLRPKRQLIGVWKKDLVSVMVETARKLKLEHIIVIWNTAGFDEMTTGHKILMMEFRNRKSSLRVLDPKQFSLKRCQANDLKGGSVKQNRKIALRLVNIQDRSPKLDVVLLNAGTILYVSGKTKNIAEGIQLAKQAVFSRSASKLLKRLVKITHDPN